MVALFDTAPGDNVDIDTVAIEQFFDFRNIPVHVAFTVERTHVTASAADPDSADMSAAVGIGDHFGFVEFR